MQTTASNMSAMEELKELNLERIVKDAQEGEVCVVNKILKGKLTDLMPLIKDPATLSQKAMEFIQTEVMTYSTYSNVPQGGAET